MNELTVFRNDLARPQQLIGPLWLRALLMGAPAAAAVGQRWCLFEVGCDALDAFVSGHIPGAAYLDTNRLEQEPFWNKIPDAELLPLLLELGIGHDTTAMLYGRNTTAAARVAHFLLYAGVRDVRLLDGGYGAWVAAGLPIALGAPQVYPPRESFGAPFPGCPHYMTHLPEARALLGQSDGALVSIRTWEEFTGQTSGYCYIRSAGEIAGAKWGRAGDDDDMNSMSAYQCHDGTMKPASEIAQFWREAGIHPHQQIAFYCGTGWRASVAFYYAWLMGWERISVFDGGWFEWSSADP